VQLGIAHTQLKNKDSAFYYLNKSLNLAVPSSATDILRAGYFAMADYYQQLNRPLEASRYYRKYIQLNDSIFSKQNAQSLAAYRTLYEVDTKEREIELLNKDKQLAQAQAERQQTIIYMVIAGLLVLLVLTLFYYRFTVRLKKLNQEITDKSHKIEAQSGELEMANRSLVDLNNELQASNEQLKLTLNHLHTTQSQLVQSEKMASLGVLSSGIAHELNNPLNFIKGGVTVLEEVIKKQPGLETEETSTLIQIINEGVSRASVILKGLGHYSRQSDQQNESCELHKIIDNCLIILGNNLKHRIVVEKIYSPTRLFVRGNEGQLHQAFINILSNAEQAIDGKGTIWIKTTMNDGNVVISIRDSGRGISKEHLSRLGDPFFTTKGPGHGTGLGLSITYQIIERHQGQISVISEPNEGAEFIISFHQ
jgi:C4-dicarboxylate-specific signal transduction histidine kinase